MNRPTPPQPAGDSYQPNYDLNNEQLQEQDAESLRAMHILYLEYVFRRPAADGSRRPGSSPERRSPDEG